MARPGAVSREAFPSRSINPPACSPSRGACRGLARRHHALRERRFGRVNLSWTASSSADSYILRRSTTAGGPYATIVDGVAGLSYADTSVQNDVTYFYVIVPKDSASGLTGAVSAEVSATPMAVQYTTLQTWRFDTFGVHDDTASVLAGDTEDFDGDGQANLLEYALATDPKVPNASPVAIGRSGNVLTLTYPRRTPADPALSYVVEAGDTPGAFAPGAGDITTVGGVSTYTDTVSLSSGARRFLRLAVSYANPQ